MIYKTRTHSTHALIFGGKIIACPEADWQATGGEKLFTSVFSENDKIFRQEKKYFE